MLSASAHKETHKKYLHVSLWVLCGLLLFTVGVWLEVFNLHKNKLVISFLDVGQGDAIYIKAPNGVEAIVDGGPDNTLSSELGSMMSFFDKKVDLIVVTNPDKDHYAGFIDFLDHFKVPILIEPGTISSTPTYHAFKEKITEKNIEEVIATRGNRIILDEKSGVFLEVLFPDRDAKDMATNDGSLVMKLVYGDTCVMLQGDSPSGVEQYIINTLKDDVSCQILKAGHHGSRTSTSKVYVEKVNPIFAIISDGKDNRYGHPHKEVIETLTNANIEILRTDREGRITFLSDGEKWERK